MVFVDRAPARIAADCVIEDDLGGARLATDHLLGHGHRRIAFIGDSIRAPDHDAATAGVPRGPGRRRSRRSTRSSSTSAAPIGPARRDAAALHPARRPAVRRLLLERADARWPSPRPAAPRRVTGSPSVSFGDFPMAASLRAVGHRHRPGPGRRRQLRGGAALPAHRRAHEAAAPPHRPPGLADRAHLQPQPVGLSWR